MSGTFPIAFRPFDTERDYQVVANLWNAATPGWPKVPAEVRAIDEHRFVGEDVVREIGELEGAPVCAYCYSNQRWAHREGRKFLAHYLLPDAKAGALSAILDRAEELMAKDGADELNLWIRDDEDELAALLEARNGRVIEHAPYTRLDVNVFDATPYQDAIRRFQEKGWRFATLSEMEAEGWDWRPEYFDAQWDMVRDIPVANKPSPLSYEDFLHQVSDRQLYDPHLIFVVLEGQRILATTGLMASFADPTFLYTGLSGVRREVRRQGLVTALKAFSIAEMQRRGAKLIQTDNVENNPMFSINLRLGFRVFCRFAHYVLTPFLR